jgi:hypothetical protein
VRFSPARPPTFDIACIATGHNITTASSAGSARTESTLDVASRIAHHSTGGNITSGQAYAKRTANIACSASGRSDSSTAIGENRADYPIKSIRRITHYQTPGSFNKLTAFSAEVLALKGSLRGSKPTMGVTV